MSLQHDVREMMAKASSAFLKVTSKDTVDFASMRYHVDQDDYIQVEQDILQPVKQSRDQGLIITVHHKGGTGYGATADTSEVGIATAFQAAKSWAEFSAGKAVVDFSKIKMGAPRGEFRSPVKERFGKLKETAERLALLSRSMKIHPQIVYWSAALWRSRSERLYVTTHGGESYQDFDRLVPMLNVVANEKAESQSRSFGGMAYVRQQGLEFLSEEGFFEKGRTLAEEARELLAAPNCPSGVMDVLIDPDQMVLQIHESIGHPLELDRILGDERNYAGTSFVTREMFGSYKYGSDLLNVTFDPSRSEQVASYAFDDDGTPARREFLIKDGVLIKPLGGTISQSRAGMEGVANSRSAEWQRPPIDRMANLNLEPGNKSFAELLGSIEKGIHLRTNTSWSIDDSRNKFQFGCEWGQLIENGKLTKVVKHPNYRGISASFWRDLVGVGDESTFKIMGTPYCGKGEPNQAVFVGHASPVCHFRGVDVFGGEK